MPDHEDSAAGVPSVVELNVGGVFYTTALSTLTRETDSHLASLFKEKLTLEKDAKGKYFLDRDGVLFRYVLDFLRNKALVLPEGFRERERLKQEASFYGLGNLEKAIQDQTDNPPSASGQGTVSSTLFILFIHHLLLFLLSAAASLLFPLPPSLSFTK